ncbi:MAG TPA: sulfate adenylyltransferase [Helicobacteraceae bacterium]|nr:sulfate adenylyltransferase [Helicobacteraceae bacterium]
MASSKRNNQLHIDQEAVSALSLVKAGLLLPVTSVMNKQQSMEVLTTGQINGKTFPFPFILAPSGDTNFKVLSETQKGDVLDIICDGIHVGTMHVDEVFEINPKERLRQIYGTDDLTHPGAQATFQRLGKLAVSGDYDIDTSHYDQLKTHIQSAINRVGAKHVTAIMMAANPLHRAHERLIRQSLDKTDLIVIFLLKPYNNADLHYNIREQTLEYFIENYLPTNRVVVVPLENSYIFAGHNEVIIDAIVARNFRCNRLMIGQNHTGVGMYYDRNTNHSIVDKLVNTNIEIDIAAEYVYCNECKTLVSTKTCPHGHHHHISYHSESILELMKTGILPPAVLVRKEISAIVLTNLYPERFKNLEKLYYDILPIAGLLEEHTEKDFYIELMRLYQTTSLT